MSREYEEKMLKMQKALISIQLKEKDFLLIEKVKFLKDVGLDYKEIAEILGSTPNSISVMFAKINKGKWKKK